jgi:hypothetical protein
MEIRVDARRTRPADASAAVPPPSRDPTASLVEIHGGLIPAPGRLDRRNLHCVRAGAGHGFHEREEPEPLELERRGDACARTGI